MTLTVDDKIQIAMVRRSLLATERRLQLAFPELVSVFWVLAAGTAKDVVWHETFDAYLSSASAAVRRALEIEIADLLAMCPSDMELGSFGGALGFDATALDDSTRDTRGLLIAMQARLGDAARTHRSAA